MGHIGVYVFAFAGWFHLKSVYEWSALRIYHLIMSTRVFIFYNFWNNNLCTAVTFDGSTYLQSDIVNEYRSDPKKCLKANNNKFKI